MSATAQKQQERKVRIIYLLLFGFLVVLLLVLCYVIFTFLTGKGSADAPTHSSDRTTTPTGGEGSADAPTYSSDKTTTPTGGKGSTGPPTQSSDKTTTTTRGKGSAGPPTQSSDKTTTTTRGKRSTGPPTQSSDKTTTTTRGKGSSGPPTQSSDKTTTTTGGPGVNTPDPSGGEEPARTITPVGSKPLICVFGIHKQNYKAIKVGNFCDYAFIPFYAETTSDTFADDGNPMVQALLNKAAASRSTQYGIHIPFKRISNVTMDVSNSAGKGKIMEYWTKKNIFNYAIFDVSGYPDGKSSSLPYKQLMEPALDLLKVLQDELVQLKANNPGPPSPERGFVAAGARIFPRGITPSLGGYLTAIQNHKLKLDLFILVTHLLEYEFQEDAPFDKCSILGGAAFEASNTKQANLVGMSTLVEKLKSQSDRLKFTHHFPPLAISVSLCTRLYMGKKGASNSELLEKECTDIKQPPDATAVFCSDSREIYFGSSITDNTLTGYSNPKSSNALLATFDTNDTISVKYCKILKEHHTSFTISLALFDVECEDWEKKCDDKSAGPLEGMKRVAAVAKYHRKVTGTKDYGKLSCDVK